MNLDERIASDFVDLILSHFYLARMNEVWKDEPFKRLALNLFHIAASQIYSCKYNVHVSMAAEVRWRNSDPRTRWARADFSGRQKVICESCVKRGISSLAM